MLALDNICLLILGKETFVRLCQILLCIRLRILGGATKLPTQLASDFHRDIVRV